MYERKVENALALLGALIVIFGVTSAANTALAAEVGPSETAVTSTVVTLEKG